MVRFFYIRLRYKPKKFPMKKFRIESVIISLGLFLLGLCIYWGMQSMAQRGRVVSVRGLAEKEVKADHVIWPIAYRTTSNDLGALYDEINQKNQKIIQFLVNNGIDKKEITTTAPDIGDRKSNQYNSDQNGDRYFVKSVLTVSTKQVDKVIDLIPRMGELLKDGIAIISGEYDTSVEYEFTSLNLIKPEMIEEATQNAREAAEKFAIDSDSDLGKIQSATQGLFSIEDRDQYTPYIKNVRVVTSVNYFLES